MSKYYIYKYKRHLSAVEYALVCPDSSATCRRLWQQSLQQAATQ